MPLASRLRQLWTIHHVTLMRVAITVMAIAALVWLGYQFWRLLFQSGYWGAIDLRAFHRMVTNWFTPSSGLAERGVLYPPATFVLLFPLVGWLDETALRWFWAIVTLVSLGGLVRWSVDASGAQTQLERIFIALIPLAIYGTGATIGNGQLGLLVLVLVLVGIRWMNQHRDWRADIGALVFLTSLLKPSIAAPFGWIVLFICGKYRRALMIGVGYILLSLLASVFRNNSLPILLQQWIGQGASIASTGGTSNLSIWLGALGVQAWILPAALMTFIALGAWVWLYRDRELWLILGVTALIARLWTYHSWYDDILILLPLMALYRLARAGTMGHRDVIAGILFALLLVFSLAPGGLYLFPEPFTTIYIALQVILWLSVLIFLLAQTRHAHSNSCGMENAA